MKKVITIFLILIAGIHISSCTAKKTAERSEQIDVPDNKKLDINLICDTAHDFSEGIIGSLGLFINSSCNINLDDLDTGEDDAEPARIEPTYTAQGDYRKYIGKWQNVSSHWNHGEEEYMYIYSIDDDGIKCAFIRNQGSGHFWGYGPMIAYFYDENHAMGSGSSGSYVLRAYTSDLFFADDDTIEIDAGTNYSATYKKIEDMEPKIIKVYINGERMSFENPLLYGSGETVVLPAAETLEKLGYKCSVSQGEVLADNGSVNIKIQEESGSIYVNNIEAESSDLTKGVMPVNGVTYIYGKMLAKAVGAAYDKDDTTDTVTITY